VGIYCSVAGAFPFGFAVLRILHILLSDRTVRTQITIRLFQAFTWSGVRIRVSWLS